MDMNQVESLVVNESAQSQKILKTATQAPDSIPLAEGFEVKLIGCPDPPLRHSAAYAVLGARGRPTICQCHLVPSLL
jgi:hypothetical protein